MVMIKINKSPVPPQVLSANKDLWTKELLDAIKQYDGFAKIPKDVKEKMWKHYRHEDIKDALISASHHKCAFCECKPGESGNIEVEHFKPKSLYPQMAFSWDNLLPVCRKCNEAKSAWDTGKEPIINPAVENPEERLTYVFLDVKSASPEDTVAKKTIEACNLNSMRLCKARSELLVCLTDYEHRLEDTLKDIETAGTDRQRNSKINKLSDSLVMLEEAVADSAKYAGFTRFFLKHCEPYQKALRLVRVVNHIF